MPERINSKVRSRKPKSSVESTKSLKIFFPRCPIFVVTGISFQDVHDRFSAHHNCLKSTMKQILSFVRAVPKIRSSLLAILLILLLHQGDSAQIPVTGTVVSDDTGERLAGVTVTPLETLSPLVFATSAPINADTPS